ncbi:MAG: Ldh family oxidoreductase [Oscillospiraceae bacterium]|nr:Ldh family oxidoreductase [Oscillospiraceae bacterium]
MSEMKQISRQELTDKLLALFQKLGVSLEDARMVADTLIKADQWGVASHGVMRVERYVRCLQSGGILPDAEFTVDQQFGGWVRASGNGGLGIPASCKATELVIKLAKEHGIAIVNLRQSHHNGAEGVYADMIAKEGMIGMVMSTGNPIMAVTGSCEATIGNNPFAYAVPAGKYGTLMMDVAMSAVADGKIRVLKSMGKLLDPGCVLDKNGNPTNVPDEYLDGGVLLPFGAHKGYGLSVMVECMAGIMSGAALTHEINSWNEIPGHCGNTGHLFMAMDISKMMDLGDYVHSVETMIEQFKNAKKAEGISEIYYPGELEQRRADQAGDKVSLLQSTWESLEAAFASCGLEF